MENNLQDLDFQTRFLEILEDKLENYNPCKEVKT